MLRIGRRRLAIAGTVAAAGALAIAGSAAAGGSHAPRAHSHSTRGVHSLPLVRGSSDGVSPAHSAFPIGTSVVNRGTGLCMSSYPNTQGTQVKQYTCNGSANQHWGEETGPDLIHYNIVSVGSGLTLCLDNYQFKFVNNNKQILWPCFSGNPFAEGYHEGASAIANSFMLHLYDGLGSLSNYCVSSLGNTSQGSGLVEYVCNKNSRNQAFYAQ
jgi:hypothetical protein